MRCMDAKQTTVFYCKLHVLKEQLKTKLQRAVCMIETCGGAFERQSHRKCRHAATGRGNAKCETIRVFLKQSAELRDSPLMFNSEELASELRLPSFSSSPPFIFIAHISLKKMTHGTIRAHRVTLYFCGLTVLCCTRQV